MSVDCEHWGDCGVPGGGCCKLEKFGGKPSEGTCLIACQGIPPKMPSGWQMFKNLLGTIKRVIVYYYQYRKLLAPRAERKRRMAICKPCGYFWPKTKRCLACGCCMKAKVLLEAAECKMDFW